MALSTTGRKQLDNMKNSQNQDKWIQGAGLNEGAFTAKAKAHKMDVQTFASYVLAHKVQFDSKTIKQANLAKNFNKMANG
jgi:hypothetical protein